MCKSGEWTKAAGDAKTDTLCSACSTGRFRAKAATDNAAEKENDVCVVRKTCKAGEWTSALGTPSTDTKCRSCAPGTARALAPTSNAVLESAAACPACVHEHLYSDESGLLKCKQCPPGHFGVTEIGSKDAGGHKACDDDTCELPTVLPTNSMLVFSKCPKHGKQHSSQNPADTCTLSCKPGFYSSSSETPFKCAPDGKTTKASYQGGVITCTGWCVQCN